MISSSLKIKSINEDGLSLVGGQLSLTDHPIINNLTVRDTASIFKVVSELRVEDKLITLNRGGAAESANESGFELEEGGVATGSIKTSSDRSSFEIRAPADTGTLSVSSSMLSSSGDLDIKAKSLTVSDGTKQISISATPNANYPLVLPTTQGNAETLLTNDGSGNLTWGAPSTEFVNKTLTVNHDGIASSGSGCGVEVEEGGAITSYIKTSSARDSFEIKTPSGSKVLAISDKEISSTYRPFNIKPDFINSHESGEENMLDIGSKLETITGMTGLLDFRGCSISKNGKYFLAGAFSNYYYKSSDYLKTISHDSTQRDYYDTGMSSDGKYQLLAYYSSSTAHALVSSDYGANFTIKTFSSSVNPVKCWASATGKYMYVLYDTAGGIAYSSDYGATWAEMSNATINSFHNLITDENETTFYGVGTDGIWTTSDLSALGSFSHLYTTGVAYYYIGVSWDGSYIEIINKIGMSARSSDFGAIWATKSITSGARDFIMSLDGKYRLIVGTGSLIEASNDYGATYETGDATTGRYYGCCCATSSLRLCIVCSGDMGSGDAYKCYSFNTLTDKLTTYTKLGNTSISTDDDAIANLNIIATSDGEIVDTISSQVIGGNKSFTEHVSITSTASQLVFGNTTTTTISATAPTANVVLTIPDPKRNAELVITEENQNINGTKKFENLSVQGQIGHEFVAIKTGLTLTAPRVLCDQLGKTVFILDTSGLLVSVDYGKSFVNAYSTIIFHRAFLTYDGFLYCAQIPGFIYKNDSPWIFTSFTKMALTASGEINETTRSWYSLNGSKDGKYLMFGATSNSLWVSNDYGTTFTTLTATNASGIQCCLSANGKYQYYCHYSSTTDKALYCSSNYGATWTTSGSYNNILSIISSDDGQYVYVASQNTPTFARSINYGTTFANLTISSGAGTICCDYTGKYLCGFNSSAYGILISDDYGTSLNTRPDTKLVLTYGCASTSFAYIYGTASNSLYRCVNGNLIQTIGQNLHAFNVQKTITTKNVAVDDNFTLNSKTETSLTTFGLSTGNGWRRLLTNYDGSVIIAFGSAIKYSLDYGRTVGTSTGLTGNSATIRVAGSRDLAVCYAVLGTDGVVYKSTDYGATWASIYDFTGLPATQICCSRDGAIVYVAILESGYNNVYRSTDGGTTWLITDVIGMMNAIKDLKCSANGVIIVCLMDGDYTYLSYNSGHTVLQYSYGSEACAISASGQYGLLAKASGEVKITRDYFITLEKTDGQPIIQYCRACAISEDGRVMASTTSTGSYYNGGLRVNSTFGYGDWDSFGIGSDGTHGLAISGNGNYIYRTNYTTSAYISAMKPTLLKEANILSITGTTKMLDLTPSVNLTTNPSLVAIDTNSSLTSITQIPFTTSISGVSISNATANQSLIYDGSNWTNSNNCVLATTDQVISGNKTFTTGLALGASGNLTALTTSQTQGNISLAIPSCRLASKLITTHTTTSAINIYVRSDGSNSNDGTANDSGHAYLTLAFAISQIPVILNHDLTVRVDDGTYAEDVELKGISGSGTITITGNTSNPSNVVLGSIKFKSITNPITFGGFSFAYVGYATAIYINSCLQATINYCSITSASYSNAGIYVAYSNVIMTYIEMSNLTNAISLSMARVRGAYLSGTTNTYIWVMSYSEAYESPYNTITATNWCSITLSKICLPSGDGWVYKSMTTMPTPTELSLYADAIDTGSSDVLKLKNTKPNDTQPNTTLTSGQNYYWYDSANDDLYVCFYDGTDYRRALIASSTSTYTP
jgi:hypothetical protein